MVGHRNPRRKPPPNPQVTGNFLTCPGRDLNQVSGKRPLAVSGNALDHTQGIPLKHLLPIWKQLCNQIRPATKTKPSVLTDLIGNESRYFGPGWQWNLANQPIQTSLSFLTLRLLLANLVHTKWCKLPEKWLKPWHMGTHLRVLSESYPMNTNVTGIRWFSKKNVSSCFEQK